MSRQQERPQPDDSPEGDDYCAILSTTAGIMMTVSGEEGTLQYVSVSCERMLGWAVADLIGTPLSSLYHPDDVIEVAATRAYQGGRESTSIDCRMRKSDGAYSWVEITSSRTESHGTLLEVSVVHDIADRRRRAMDLESRATTDPLTGVMNRTVLMDRLALALRRLGRSSGIVAVLYVDLDHFKVINDSLGHRVGDDVLASMAQRLTHHLRPGDTLARLGGDEFVIVAEDMIDEKAAIGLANRVIDAGRRPFRVGEEEFGCTLSIGVACTADSQRSADDLLSESDMALYRAKDGGRNRAELFDEALRTKAIGRMVTERMLRGALSENRVKVEYQPVIDLRSSAMVSVEALVRIQDSTGAICLPATFLEVAEETGLLISLDSLVLADAVHQAAGWVSRLDRSAFGAVAVNVTARHLADSAFSRSAIALLDAANLPHQWLHVEVTERVLMEASNSAMTGLRALRDAGIRVGLDDFGTGYSSLAYLRQFPLDFVKLDKLFVDDLENDPRQRSITAGIIGLCHALDLIVIAEGVESAGQAVILRSLGCDQAQGYLFARSTTPAGIDTFVQTETWLRGSGDRTH